MELSLNLHEEMKNHTGGELTKYIVRIDKSGEAEADFEYDSASYVKPSGNAI